MKPEILTGIAAIISAITALTAVFIGPLITSKINREETRSTMREKWVSELRQILSELISTAETSAAVLVQARVIIPELKEAYDKLVQLEGNAKMMLSPTKQNHQCLQAQLGAIVKLAANENIQSKEKILKMRILTESIIPLAQVVLSEAWEAKK